MNELKREIEEALAKVTPGKWRLSPGDMIDEPAAVYVILDEIHAQTIADNLLGVDARLIANAPTWFRQLLDELTRKEDENQRLHEENHLVRIERDKAIFATEAQAKEIERLKLETIDEVAAIGNLEYLLEKKTNELQALREDNARYLEVANEIRLLFEAWNMRGICEDHLKGYEKDAMLGLVEMGERLNALIGSQETKE
jgi:hypothetical protein